MRNLQLLILIAPLKVVFSPTFPSLCTTLKTEKTLASDRGKHRKSQWCFMFLFSGPQRGATLFEDISSLTLTAFCLCLGLLKDQKQCVISILFISILIKQRSRGIDCLQWQMELGFDLYWTHLFPPELLLKLAIVSHVFYLLSPPELSPSRLCPLCSVLLPIPTQASLCHPPSQPFPLCSLDSWHLGQQASTLGPVPEGSLHFLPPQRPWLSSENRDAVSLSRGTRQSSTSHIAQGILPVRHCCFQTRTSHQQLIPFRVNIS